MARRRPTAKQRREDSQGLDACDDAVMRLDLYHNLGRVARFLDGSLRLPAHEVAHLAAWVRRLAVEVQEPVTTEQVAAAALASQTLANIFHATRAMRKMACGN